MRAPSIVPKLGLERFSGLYLWALFIITFSIWVPDFFFTSATLHSVASAQVVPAVLSLAITIPLAAGVYDLSIGSAANLAAVLVCVLQTVSGLGMWESIGLTLLVGVVIGLVNGFIVVKLHVSSLIATLGTSVVLTAFQEMIQGAGGPQPPTDAAWANLTQHEFGGFQVIVGYIIVIALLCWWILDRTPAGRYVYAVGGNDEAARLAGVAVGKWQVLTLVGSGFLGSIGGILYASQSGPSLTFGGSLLLPAFAAAFLGSTQFTPGRVNVWGTVLAVYVLATGVKGLQFVTGVAWLNDMFSGVALIAAVAFAVWRQRAGVADAAGRGEKREDPDNGASEQESGGSDPPSGSASRRHALKEGVK